MAVALCLISITSQKQVEFLIVVHHRGRMRSIKIITFPSSNQYKSDLLVNNAAKFILHYKLDEISELDDNKHFIHEKIFLRHRYVICSQKLEFI